MNITIATTNAGGAERAEDRTEPAKPARPSTGSVVTTTGCARVPSGAADSSKVGLDVVDRLLHFLDRSPFACAAHIGDLREDVAAVARQVVGEMVRLPGETPAARPSRMKTT